MKPISEIQMPRRPSASETLMIRFATPADANALRRLAQLDSAPPTPPGPTLVAEVGGELHAAIPVDGGRPIADPFRPTAELVAMLVTRARGLQARTSAGPRRRRALIRLLRPA